MQEIYFRFSKLLTGLLKAQKICSENKRANQLVYGLLPRLFVFA